jgi:TusA-related sulfurtransferase
MSKRTFNLDLLGLKCPFPVLKITKKFKEIRVGDQMNVQVDDPKAEIDIEELVKNINIKILEKKKIKKSHLLVKLIKY